MLSNLSNKSSIAAKCFALASAIVFASGCSTTQPVENALELGVQYEWQDQNLAAADISKLSLEEFTVRKKGLHLKVSANFVSDQLQYTATSAEGLKSEQADSITEHARFQRCSTQQHQFLECLASTDPLTTLGVVRVDEKLTGREHTFSAPINDAKMVKTHLLLVLTQGELRHEVSLSPRYFTFNVDQQTVYIPLKRLIEQVPFKPEQVEMQVTVSANVDENSPTIEASKTLNLSIERLASLNLNAVQWLSKQEQKVIYLSEIKQSLLDKDYQAAWDNLNRLKDLDISLPPSFNYRYGQAMYLAGEPAQAKKYLRYFIEYVDKNFPQENNERVNYQLQYQLANKMLNDKI